MTVSPSPTPFIPARCTPTEVWNHVVYPSSWMRWRIHHTTSSVVVTPGVMTALEKASEMIAWTVSSIFR